MNGSQVRRSRFDGKYHPLRTRRKRAQALEAAMPQFDARPRARPSPFKNCPETIGDAHQRRRRKSNRVVSMGFEVACPKSGTAIGIFANYASLGGNAP